MYKKTVEIGDIRGVRYIVCDNIVIVLTMCNLTLSSILQNPNKTPNVRYGVHTYISLRDDEAG